MYLYFSAEPNEFEVTEPNEFNVTEPNEFDVTGLTCF